MLFRPNITGLRFQPDGTAVLLIGYVSERSTEAYAHTVILSGPDKRLWRVTLTGTEGDIDALPPLTVRAEIIDMPVAGVSPGHRLQDQPQADASTTRRSPRDRGKQAR